MENEEIEFDCFHPTEDEEKKLWQYYEEHIEEEFKNTVITLIRNFETEQLLNIIESEKSEVIAKILLCMKHYEAPVVFDKLALNTKASVIENIVEINEISPKELKNIEEILTKKTSNTVYEKSLNTNGLMDAIGFLDYVDSKSYDKIIEILEEKNPEVEKKIFKEMLIFKNFEDIVKLDRKFLKKILPKIDNHDLGVALKGIDEKEQDCIFHNIKKCKARKIKKEMECMGQISVEDLLETQYKIIKYLYKLKKENK